MQKSYGLELERLEVEISKVDSILEIKPAVDLLLKIEKFTNAIRTIIVVKEKINEIQEMLSFFDPLEEIDDIYSVNEIMLVAIEIISIKEDINNIINEIESLNNQLQEDEICPTCGQTIKEKHEKTT